jgi:hypothetical protein
MRLFSSFWIAMAILSFQDCAPNNDADPSKVSTENAGNDSVLVLEGLSVPLLLRLNPEVINLNELNHQYNSMLGQIEVNCGEAIQLRISEEMLSLEELKNELLEDQLFTYKFEQESATELVYLTVLPDGSEISYQYMKLANLAGKSFLIRTEPMGEYTLQNVEIMKTIVATLVAKEA